MVSGMFTVGIFTLVVNLTATAKELLVAHQFGTGDVLDALLIAMLLPSFAINVVTGSFSTAMIPTFIRVQQQDGPVEAQRFLSNMTSLNFVLLIVVSMLLTATVPFTIPILGSGFGLEKLALTRSLFFVLVPILIINGFTKTWTAVLNAKEHFSLAAFSPTMIPLLATIFLLFLGRVWGIYALAIGTLSGFVIEAGLLAWGLKREGYSLKPRWYGWDPPMRRTMAQYLPVMAGALLMSSTTLIDQSMAAMLGPGSVSTLNYGNKIVALVVGIGSVSLGTAVFPHFSRMAATEDWEGLRRTLKTHIFFVLLVTVPLTAGLVYWSRPLVRLLFERGAFTSADTYLVSQVQSFYLLQIPFYFLGILIIRLISSVRANHILMEAAMLNLVAKLVLNYLLMRRFGAAGIALSTTLVYVLSLVFCTLMVYRRIPTLGWPWKP
jgi:putative peptidoglycan lipid II flippase